MGRFLVLGLVWLVGVVGAGAQVRNGKYGENAEWEFHKFTGILRISGSGDIDSSYNDGIHKKKAYVPWEKFRKSIKFVRIDEGITSIGYGAFSGCTELTAVSIPNSVRSIGDGAFLKCKKLTSIDIPNSVKSIGSSAFFDCENLESITIPNSVTSIGMQAFYKCLQLKTITLPNGLESIEEDAFSGCDITTITIPRSVKHFRSDAFVGCQLKSMKVEWKHPIKYDAGPDVIDGGMAPKWYPDSCTLYVPKGTAKEYRKAKGWNEFKEIVEY